MRLDNSLFCQLNQTIWYEQGRNKKNNKQFSVKDNFEP